MEINDSKNEPRFYTIQDLANCYSAGMLRGMADAHGTADGKVMTPEEYFLKNFGVNISNPPKLLTNEQHT